jgi:hypothetical protein
MRTISRTIAAADMTTMTMIAVAVTTTMMIAAAVTTTIDWKIIWIAALRLTKNRLNLQKELIK